MWRQVFLLLRPLVSLLPGLLFNVQKKREKKNSFFSENIFFYIFHKWYGESVCDKGWQVACFVCHFDEWCFVTIFCLFVGHVAGCQNIQSVQDITVLYFFLSYPTSVKSSRHGLQNVDLILISCWRKPRNPPTNTSKQPIFKLQRKKSLRIKQNAPLDT